MGRPSAVGCPVLAKQRPTSAARGSLSTLGYESNLGPRPVGSLRAESAGGVMRPRIFVGSSRETIRICRAIQSELRDEFEVTVWNQGVFKLTYTALDSLLDVLDSSDAGIF